MIANLPDWLGQLLYGYRHITNNGAAVDDSDTLNVLPPLTAAFNPVTGKVDVALDGDIAGDNVAATTSITVGAQTPPQYMASVGETIAVSGGGVTPLLTVPVPVNSVVTIDFSINASIRLPVPGILLPGALDVFAIYANYGTSGPCLVGAIPDTGRTTVLSPWISGLLTFNTTANSVIPVAHAYTPPAWIALHAYVGGFADGSTLPNAVGDSSNAIVANGVNLYVCTAPGTSAASGGPTGTGVGPITDGTVTWYYVGPAAGGVTTMVTVTLGEVKTG